jgi:acetoin utilization deacetylase AcuC-like enzyme
MDVERVHDPSYLAWLKNRCQETLTVSWLDPDTYITRRSFDAALHAAGAAVAAAEQSLNGEHCFAFVRPPGHHAEYNRAMGFCLMNNVAVAAKKALMQVDRIAIVDWDVHHGNGTQTLVGPDPAILYISVHQSSFYPFEGHLEDIDLDAKGTTVNIPLPAGTAGDVYRKAWSELVLPVLEQFAPDWVLVSAGFDAHTEDPLAELDLLDADFGWMASALAKVHEPARTVFALEGGYDLDALRHSARSTLLGMAGEESFGPPLHSIEGAEAHLNAARAVIAGHWNV